MTRREFTSEKVSYYPFGLTHKGYNADHKIIIFTPETHIIQLVPVTPDLTDTYKYKFGGKEWQDELDLNYYDFGARNYYAALVRTFTPDPMAEVYYELSPYSFLNNNPISNIDPTGAVTLSGQAAKDWLQNKKDEIASKPRKRKEKEDEENEIDGGVLETVYITNAKDRSWSSETSLYEYQRTQDDYKSEYPEYAGLSDAAMMLKYRSENGYTYEQWSRKSEAAHRLAAFINRFKFIAYDTGVLQGTEEILGWSIGSTAAPFVGRTASNSLRSIQKLVNSQKLLRISNPNILNKTLPGYTDAIEGTIYRQGREPLMDYPTHKPAVQPINNQYFNRIGGASTGVGLTALAYYYYHRKTIRK